MSYKLYTAWAQLPPAPVSAPATDQLQETGGQEAEQVQLHGDTPPPSYDECMKNYL